MKDLIAQNAGFVLKFGQPILFGFIFLLFYGILRIGKHSRFFIPNSITGWIGSILSVLFIFIASLAIFGLQNERNTTGKVLKQFESMLLKKAPELTFNRVDNNVQENIRDYRGRIIILNLWATWCAPCIREMPDLSQLQQDFKKDLVVITLSDETHEKLLNFHKQKTFYFTSVYNKQIEWLEFGIGTARPLTFIIDREGIIREYFTGARDYNFYSKKIKEFL